MTMKAVPLKFEFVIFNLPNPGQDDVCWKMFIYDVADLGQSQALHLWIKRRWQIRANKHKFSAIWSTQPGILQAGADREQTNNQKLFELLLYVASLWVLGDCC